MNRISIISSNELKTLEKNEYVFVNFAHRSALKISYFYEKIKKDERDKLMKLFNQLTGIEIRVDDNLGKLNIILLKLLMDGEKDNIIISNIGFHMVSFDFLISNLEKIFENLDGLSNKNIIIVECNLDNTEEAKFIDQYFDV
ncbi:MULTISPECIES: hypothetical protein [unclassified Chryseobacterium]|uniref:hypothetical protein n=1 Tax=unclassified Chryseobacterium TaxID=2593645 RepID=UPI0030101FE7